VRRVAVVILTSADGRVPLPQARPVLAARKPLFVDKPFTASVRDALELARLARESGTPMFSTSSQRYADDVQAIARDPRLSTVLGAITWGPAPTEPHHPDLVWYGIHAVEMLYTFMGRGCAQVTRTHTAGADVVVGRWADGRIGVVRGIRDGATSYGQVVYGPKDILSTPAPAAPTAATAAPPKRSSYYGLLTSMVEFFRTGKPPVAIEDTLEIMAFMEAADVSKARGGAPVALADVMSPAR